MVTGAVAILAEAFPNQTPEQWTDRILASANNQIGFAEGECSVLGGDSYEDDPTVSSKTGAPALLAADAIVSSSSISMVVAAVALVTLGTAFLISRLRSTYKPIPEEQV